MKAKFYVNLSLLVLYVGMAVLAFFTSLWSLLTFPTILLLVVDLFLKGDYRVDKVNDIMMYFQVGGFIVLAFAYYQGLVTFDKAWHLMVPLFWLNIIIQNICTVVGIYAEWYKSAKKEKVIGKH